MKLAFDEAQIFAASAKLTHDDASHQLAFEIKINGYDISVFVRDEKNILSLKKTRVEVFRAP